MSDRLRGIAEFAYASARSAIEAGGISRYAKLARKLNVLVDAEIDMVHREAAIRGQRVDCRKGCDACCHRMVAANAPELIDVLEHVTATFTPDQIVALRDSISAMEKADADFWATRSAGPVSVCPFLVNHECSIYDHRPTPCRALNSFDASVCDRFYIQHEHLNLSGTRLEQQDSLSSIASVVIAAGRELHAPSGLYELGTAIGALIDDPAALETGLLEKYKIVSELNRQAPIRCGVIDDNFQNPAKAEIMEAFRTETLSQRWQKLDAFDGTPFGAIYRLQFPSHYASQDELDFWWSRFGESLERFEEGRFPAQETFELLQQFHTFHLAYAGKNVKPYLERLMKVVHRYASEAFPSLTASIEAPRKPGKPRVGFISYRIKRYNGSRWALGWLMNLSSEIETYVINLAEQEDNVSGAFRRHADRYLHIQGTATNVAPIIRSLDLDALIFTDIGMDGLTIQLSGLRLARRQMNAWGHPVTSGSPTMDDYLSSALMEPENGDEHYTEKLQRLPGSGLTYPRFPIVPSQKTHAELGVPEDGYLLCCQNPLKFIPENDHLFVEIATRSTKPIVIFTGNIANTKNELESRLAAQGVRAIFSPMLNTADYLRVLQLADTSLDLQSWSGGNTTIEALALGTPVVSLPGEFMRGRHALAFLTQANVSGLIAKDAAEYVEFAVDLDRQREIMRNVNVDGLYEVAAPAQAISNMLCNS